MKIRRITAIGVLAALVCGLLAGCSQGSSTILGPSGDMEAAVAALKWQDYETAYKESTAFIERVPHSYRAQVVQQTAAWSMLYLEKEQLDEYLLDNGVVHVNSTGFQVKNMLEDPNQDFYLKSYSVELSYDRDYFNQDFAFETVTVNSITVSWGYTYESRTFEYRIYQPGNLYKEDLKYSIENFASAYAGSGSDLSDEVEQKLLKYLDDVLVDSLNEVFSVIEKKYDIAPAHLGFTNWEEEIQY